MKARAWVSAAAAFGSLGFAFVASLNDDGQLVFAWTVAACFAAVEAMSQCEISDLERARREPSPEASKHQPTDVFTSLETDLDLWIAEQVSAYTHEVEALREAAINQVERNEDDGLSPSAAQQMAIDFYRGGLSRLFPGGDA